VEEHALVTGFPRLLARRMAEALRARRPAARLSLLAHGEHEAAARDFAAEVRGEVLVGDVSAMHLGLATSEYRDLVATLTDVVHAAEHGRAADAQMRRVNVEGTRSALELGADCARLSRFTHFSTVYVAGDRVGVVAEDELAEGQAFRNVYEQTKFEAELLVRRAMGSLPCTVLRTPLVAGAAQPDEPPCVAALLAVASPLHVAVPLPRGGAAPLHAAPIDYVVAAATHVHHDARAVGRTFHLCDPNPSSARRVHELIARREGKSLPQSSLGYRLTDALLRLPGLEKLSREQRGALSYVDQLAFFSTRNTLEVLEGSGIRCPPLESWLDALLEHARAEFATEAAGSPRRRAEPEGRST
jgi:nucleoside-diphosphate-sugar epimerase